MFQLLIFLVVHFVHFIFNILQLFNTRFYCLFKALFKSFCYLYLLSHIDLPHEPPDSFPSSTAHLKSFSWSRLHILSPQHSLLDQLPVQSCLVGSHWAMPVWFGLHLQPHFPTRYSLRCWEDQLDFPFVWALLPT